MCGLFQSLFEYVSLHERKQSYTFDLIVPFWKSRHDRGQAEEFAGRIFDMLIKPSQNVAGGYVGLRHRI